MSGSPVQSCPSQNILKYTTSCTLSSCGMHGHYVLVIPTSGSKKSSPNMYQVCYIHGKWIHLHSFPMGSNLGLRTTYVMSGDRLQHGLIPAHCERGKSKSTIFCAVHLPHYGDGVF